MLVSLLTCEVFKIEIRSYLQFELQSRSLKNPQPQASQKCLNTAILWKTLHPRGSDTGPKPCLLPAQLLFHSCLALCVNALSFTQKSEMHLAERMNN